MMSREEEVRTVQLKRSESYGFGFSILGGSGSELPPIIYDIVENSPAAASGELEAGDVILEVNDKEVVALTTKEVLKCLRLSSDVVNLKLRRDPQIKEKVRKYLLASSNDMSTMRQAISREDLDGVEEVIARKSPSRHPQLPHPNGIHQHDKMVDAEFDHYDNSSGHNGVESRDSGPSSWPQTKTPPRFETFMMTGDLILNLNAQASSSATALIPKTKCVDSLTFSHQMSTSSPGSPEETSSSSSDSATKRTRPAPPPNNNNNSNSINNNHNNGSSYRSSPPDKKSFGYTGSFVRTSKSEDHLQKDSLTTVNIDIDDDMASSLNTLMDTRHENPANERIVWTYNAPVSQDTSSSSPQSSSPTSPLQSPTYRPLRSPSPTKPLSPRRRAGSADEGVATGNSSSPSPSSCSSPVPPCTPPMTSTSTSAPARLGDMGQQTQARSSEGAQWSKTDAEREAKAKRTAADANLAHAKAGHYSNEPSAKAIRQPHDHTFDGTKEGDSSTVTRDTLYQKTMTELSCKLDRENSESGASGPSSMTIALLNKESGGSPRKSASPPPDDDWDLDSLRSFHYSPKAVDMPSACRLAKRLFHLEGFKRSDVSRHLCKNNEFSFVVAEEYLKFFDFTGDTLDLALRKFLRQFALTGETQERERVLVHYSKRYLDCNPGTFNSQDAVHTLTCALMLLNTDLHGQNIGRKMTCAEFIDNLSELNDGDNFPRDVLKVLYHSIKTQPLEWVFDDDEYDELNTSAPEAPRRTQEERANMIGHNPFLEVPNTANATEYKKGYVMRKCCIDPNGKRTPFGKRGWKMFYATLKDLVLYLHKDEHGFKKNQLYDNLHNSIRVHHALATKATDYTKKQHVFRLQTSEWAVYLFQTSDSKELQSWIDTINFVAASLSARPLAGPVGSQRKFQRPLLPCTHSKFNLKEQLQDHENQVLQLEQDSEEHRARVPERGSRSRMLQEYQEKEAYLQFELKRYRTYSYLIRSRITQYPDLEHTLAETCIGEVDEREPDTTSAVVTTATSPCTKDRAAAMASADAKRNISDRSPRELRVPQTPHEVPEFLALVNRPTKNKTSNGPFGRTLLGGPLAAKPVYVSTV